MKSHKTHQPYDVDGLHDPVSGRWGGPTGTFWPNPATLHAYSDGIARGTTHGPWAGGGESSTSQLTWRSGQKTKPAIGAS